ncbi:MAG: hypothetical protein ACUZ8H_00790 [Candidatus Anammoxibacter sp.]
MANLDFTIWNDWQAQNATNEKRFVSHGVIDLVKKSTAFCDFITPDIIEKFKTFSADRGIKIPVIEDQTVSVVTTPGFNFIPDNLTTSQQYTFTAFNVFSGFRHYKSIYANNTIAADFDKNVKMTNVANEMANVIEGILTGVLDTRRTQILGFTTQINQSSGSGTYTFDTGADVLKINKAAQQETMFSALSTLMAANKLPGSYASVVSPAGLAVQKLEALKFGAANDKNIAAIGMISAEDMHNSHNISAGSDVFNGYWVKKGAIGMYSNHPFDFIENSTVGTAKWHVSDVELPFIKMRANIYTDQFKANATGLVGTGTDTNVIMSAGEEMAIWARFYVVFPFNSDLSSRASDIVKIQGLTS